MATENNPKITEKNVLMEVDRPDGSIERKFPITKSENIIGLQKAVESSPKYNAALTLLATNAFIIDDVTGELYKVGASNGRLYFTHSDEDIRPILGIIKDALDELTTPGESN